MNLKAILILFLAVLIGACENKKSFLLSELKPLVLEKKGTEIFQYWEFQNDKSLWESNSGELSAIRKYKNSLIRALGKVKFEQALRKEKNVHRSPAPEISPDDGDKKNTELVHSGNLGKIREMNRLEAQLLNYQLSRYPLFSHPTEFHAFIAVHDSLNLVRVYFCSSDQPWPPKPKIILSELEKEFKKGWKLKYHLHNHYEPKSNNYIGILAPSMADAQYFKMLDENYKIKKALITNGFNTLELKHDEFYCFESH